LTDSAHPRHCDRQTQNNDEVVIMRKELGLFDLLYVIAKHKWLVIVFTAVFAVGSIIYALVTPKHWVSKTVIVPVADNASLSGLDSGLLGMIGSGLLSGSKTDPAVEFVSIMRSRSFRERVINEFDLLKYFKLTDNPRDEAMELAVFKVSSKLAKINADEESKMITVRIETKDKLFSKKIAEFYLAELQDYLRNNRGSKSKLQREFLESQVAVTKLTIDSLATAVKQFQQKNRAIGLDEQTASLITLYSESISDFYKAEMEYNVALKQYGEGSPVLEELASRRDYLKTKVKELEGSGSKLMPEYVIQIDRIPDLSLQFAQLKLNLEIQKKVFEYLYPQYEIARLDEARDMPSFDILDPPSMAGLRSKPKRALLVSIVTFMAFLLACFVAIVKENVINTHKAEIDRVLSALKSRPASDSDSQM